MSDRLAEQLAICDAATEGPWESDDLYTSDGEHRVHARAEAFEVCEALERDATFIATARTALPDALYTLAKCRHALNEVREWRKETSLCPVCDCLVGGQHTTDCWIPLALEALAAIEQVGQGEGDNDR